MEYQTLTAIELRPLVVMWQRLRSQGWELDSSVKHTFNWKRFRFEYKLRVFRQETEEYNLEKKAVGFN
jgi:hypothetical protein